MTAPDRAGAPTRTEQKKLRTDLWDYRLQGFQRRRTDILTRRLSEIYCRLFNVSPPVKFMPPRRERQQAPCVGGCGKMLYPMKNNYKAVYCNSECSGFKWHKLGSEYVHGLERKADLVYDVRLPLPAFVALDRDKAWHKELMAISARIRDLTKDER